MNPLPSSSDDGAPPPAPSTPALDWAVAHGAVDEVFARVEAKRRRRSRQRLAAATGVLGVMLIASVALWPSAHPAPASPTATTATAVAAATPQRQLLADGTVVELRDGARLVVAFTAGVRRVRLEHGEAHFTVEKDPQRPFVVEAGGLGVRAVGTAFTVQLGAQNLEVVVTEGRVAVEQVAATTAPLAFTHLDAGHRVVVALDAPVPAAPVPLSAAELDERLAWRVPRLALAATPLAQAIAFFNAHSAPRLVLADPALGRLELSGTIRADSPEPLLRLLRAEFGLSAERRGDEVVLRRGR